MAKQTSINVQPVKGGSEEHNKRKKKLDYVRKDLSHLNEYWECDTQANRLANIFCPVPIQDRAEDASQGNPNS